MIETIHELTIRSGAWQETTVLVGKLNRALRGWANYFEVGSVTKVPTYHGGRANDLLQYHPANVGCTARC